MTQIQVNYFLKTCETGNIASAAEALFLFWIRISAWQEKFFRFPIDKRFCVWYYSIRNDNNYRYRF